MKKTMNKLKRKGKDGTWESRVGVVVDLPRASRSTSYSGNLARTLSQVWERVESAFLENFISSCQKCSRHVILLSSAPAKDK